VLQIVGGPDWYPVVLALFGVLLAWLAQYDVRHRRIPNAALYPAIAAALALALAEPAAPWWSYAGGGLFAGALIVALELASRGGIGYGDAKLAALIGLLLGWPAVLVGLFVAFAVGAAAGLALVAGGRLARAEPMPFAPALAAGALAGLLVGQPVARFLWPGLT